MSDTYYRERAARRTRALVIIGVLAAAVICAVFGIASLFYDACTRSFDRSPRSIVLAFVNAVGRGDAAAAQECWEHYAYYELKAGCSEVCLARVLGAQYRVVDITLDPPHTTPDGRANLRAVVSIECAKDGKAHSGEILLDSVGGNAPWKHWAIIHSTFGGTVAEPWCK
ncbi:MAG: hypothetical protein WBW48_11775 [Anaerolineae bacterium]